VTTVRNFEFSAQFGAHSLVTTGCFLGVKRPGRVADQSPLFSANVENEWSYTSTPTCNGMRRVRGDQVNVGNLSTPLKFTIIIIIINGYR
jgi:hypothetical protein